MKKRNKKELSLPILMLIGAALSVLLVIASSFVFTLIASLTKDPGALIGMFSLASLIFAGALSGFIITKLFRDGGSLIALLSAVFAALIMSVIGLIAKKGTVPLSVFLNYLAYVGVAALFAFLAGKKRKKKVKFR